MLPLASLFVAVAAMASTASAALTSADVGNWTVGDCLLAQFAMELTVRPDPVRLNETLDVKVPVSARADAGQDNCEVDEQDLTLDWTITSSNGTVLNRNLTIAFTRRNDSATPSYGVSRFYGTFELAHFQQNYTKGNASEMLNVTSYVSMDTGELKGDKIMFRVPINRSFLCTDLGNLEIASYLHFSFPDAPTQGSLLPNATSVVTKHVAFDAFRPKDAPPRAYQVPMDCDYQPNDIVPIIVGVALALLVVFVLIAYMVGRRRHRQRGYTSV